METEDGLPCAWKATGLPEGLTIDPTFGLISGRAVKASDYDVTITATSERGTDTATLRLHMDETGLPAGLSIDEKTGVIRGVPSEVG